MSRVYTIQKKGIYSADGGLVMITKEMVKNKLVFSTSCKLPNSFLWKETPLSSPTKKLICGCCGTNEIGFFDLDKEVKKKDEEEEVIVGGDIDGDGEVSIEEMKEYLEGIGISTLNSRNGEPLAESTIRSKYKDSIK